MNYEAMIERYDQLAQSTTCVPLQAIYLRAKDHCKYVALRQQRDPRQFGVLEETYRRDLEQILELEKEIRRLENMARQ